MNLFFKRYGEGSKNLLILHGLFGSLDNWQSIARQLSEYRSEGLPSGLSIYTIDLRNHGHSPHSNEWSYSLMANDVVELISSERIDKPFLLGHSMGGKTAMSLAGLQPGLLQGLLIADISPRYYPPHHGEIIEALRAVNVKSITSRKEAETVLQEKIKDPGTRQFLLKNLYWKTDSQLDWRFNLEVLAENIEEVGVETILKNPCLLPAIFIKGQDSNYIQDRDESVIHKLFPNSEIETIPQAGHWLHADQPALMIQSIVRFIEKISI